MGLVSELDGSGCVMKEVSSEGELTGEDLHFELDEIIGLEWSTDYLMALAILLEG